MLQQIRTKFPAVFLAVCMALSLSACGNTTDKEMVDASTQTAPPVEGVTAVRAMLFPWQRIQTPMLLTAIPVIPTTQQSRSRNQIPQI